jgi:hypothetical protein
MTTLRVLATLFIIAAAVEEIPVSPKQAAYLAEVKKTAVEASKSAEAELISEFRSPRFVAGLLSHGAFKLAMTPADKLLEQVKIALTNMEYTSNFGVSEAFRKTHPGQPSMNFSTIDELGRIPTMWELRALNSSLVAGIPDKQWKILEAAETGEYRLPIDVSSKLPAGPT